MICRAITEEPWSKKRAMGHGYALLRAGWLYASRIVVESPIFCLTRAFLARTMVVTHLPRLSPARVTRIKGRFFYCAQCGEGA